ncbi:sulfite reductase [Aliarcobacter butzleri]|uniref:sulfite reductase n=1 Tax=Aliarcobacter butzleri TaxID=28197 RepID=UPI00344F6A2E
MSQNLNIEKIKKEKKTIDILTDIYFYAIFGELIPLEDLERFNWYGIYAQDEKQEFFELRIPLFLGELNLIQLKTLNELSKKYSNSSLMFCKEQKVILKNLKIKNIPDIFKELNEVNLNTFFENGHTVRRVLTCPVNGIDKTQILDVEPLANKLNDTFIGNRNFSNLPNKLHIAISGYEEGCDVAFTPDISFNATKDSKGKIIFALNILDKNIGFITPSSVVKCAICIANIYKDFGDRDDIEKSSFEYLIKDLGYVRFFDILNSMMDYKVQKSAIISKDKTPKKPRFGINESKIEGQSYIGCRLGSNEFSSSTIDNLLALFEKYNASKIKITHKGNIIILDVPAINAKNLASDLEKTNFNPFV